MSKTKETVAFWLTEKPAKYKQAAFQLQMVFSFLSSSHSFISADCCHSSISNAMETIASWITKNGKRLTKASSNKKVKWRDSNKAAFLLYCHGMHFFGQMYWFMAFGGIWMEEGKRNCMLTVNWLGCLLISKSSFKVPNHCPYWILYAACWWLMPIDYFWFFLAYLLSTSQLAKDGPISCQHSNNANQWVECHLKEVG